MESYYFQQCLKFLDYTILFVLLQENEKKGKFNRKFYNQIKQKLSRLFSFVFCSYSTRKMQLCIVLLTFNNF